MVNYNKSCTIITVVFILVFLFWTSQGVTINLKSRTVDTATVPSLLDQPPSLVRQRFESGTSSQHFKRQFFVVTSAKGEEKRSIENTIHSRLVHLSPEAYLAYTSVDDVLQAKKSQVEWVGEINAQDKVEVGLESVEPISDEISLLAILPPFDEFDSLKSEEIAATIQNKANSLGLRTLISSSSSKKISIKILAPLRATKEEKREYFMNAKNSMLGYLMSHTDIHYVEQKPEYRTLNKWASSVVQGGFFQSSRPIDNKGVTGKDQIVGIGDTGIDMNNCFFSDPNVPTPYNTTNFNHRKVVSYVTYADGYDEEDGHGTHVSGSVAGQTSGSLGNYNGMAEEAKIAFFDVGVAGENALYIPDDLYENFFPYFSDADAHIDSNSWGCASTIPISCNKYSSQAADIDKWMYENEDDIVLFAAGNAGSGGFYSVGAPATNKNGLAVGASINQKDSWREVCKLHQDSFCGIYTETEREDLASFSSRGPTTQDNRFKPEVVAPGNYIVSARGRNPSVTVEACSEEICSSYYSEDCSDTDALTYMSGTSMATPVTAGTTALVRQWFMDGYYPTGVKTPTNSITPKGATMKAILIHSAVPVSGAVDLGFSSWIKLPESYPNSFVGYGRVQLNNVLKFDDSPFNIFVSQSSSVDHTSTEKHCFQLSGKSQDIRVTMVYTDLPADVWSDRALVNDLDLIVSYNGKEYQNEDHSNTQEHVSIPVEDNEYSFSVFIRGNYVPDGPQKYSLVVTGEGLEEQQCGSSCLNGCNGHGTCTQGVCECDSGWTGVDCSQDITDLEECTQISRSLAQSEWKYFEYQIPNSVPTPFNVHFIVSFSAEVYVSRSSKPSKSDYEWSNGNDLYNLTISSEGSNLSPGETLEIGLSSSSYSKNLCSLTVFTLPADPIPIDENKETKTCGGSFFFNSETQYLSQVYKLNVIQDAKIQIETLPEYATPYGMVAKDRIPTSDDKDFSVSPTRIRKQAVSPGTYYFNFYPGTGTGSFRFTVGIPEQCSGTKTLTEQEGTITDHVGPRYSIYSSELDCEWVIQPSMQSGDSIILSFSNMAIPDPDNLIISADGAQVAEHSGFEIPESMHTTSNSLTLKFSSDWYSEGGGFTAHYKVIPSSSVSSSSSSSDSVSQSGSYASSSSNSKSEDASQSSSGNSSGSTSESNGSSVVSPSSSSSSSSPSVSSSSSTTPITSSSSSQVQSSSSQAPSPEPSISESESSSTCLCPCPPDSSASESKSSSSRGTQNDSGSRNSDFDDASGSSISLQQNTSSNNQWNAITSCLMVLGLVLASVVAE
eukprot:gb/GECH01011464.1/.p1 GENE.gb/GECH01011464.1/~~gb/GECH01011464.1/.p1  ORF type:complete len:1288 (+),score=256.97 gb/GECH01011464.1/:1-3864(+)